MQQKNVIPVAVWRFLLLLHYADTYMPLLLLRVYQLHHSFKTIIFRLHNKPSCN